MTIRLILTVIWSVTAVAFSAEACTTGCTTLIDLNSCITAGNSYCSLNPTPAGGGSYYTVSSSNAILLNSASGMASSVTVDGGGAILISDGSTTNGIIPVNYQCAGCSGLKIQNFQLYNSSSYCTTSLGTTHTPPLLAITHADILGGRNGSGTWPSNPLSYTGPYAVEIYNNVFNCGQGGDLQPGAGILATAGGASYTNDLYIHGNYFEWSTVEVSGGNASEPYGTTGCDVVSAYKDSKDIYTPRNIVLTGNYWYNSGEGSLSISHDRYVQITNNSLTDDNWVHQAVVWSDSYPYKQGGTIYIDQCADTVTLYGNTLSGPAASTSPSGTTSVCPPGINTGCVSQTNGIEMYGRNIQIGSSSTSTSNTISNYYLEGVSISNAYNATVYGNTLNNTNQSGYAPYGSLHVWDLYSVYPSGSSRQGTSISLISNTISNTASGSSNTWGITLANGSSPTPTGISISGNTVSSGAGYQCYKSPFSGSSSSVSGATSSYSYWSTCP